MKSLTVIPDLSISTWNQSRFPVSTCTGCFRSKPWDVRVFSKPEKGDKPRPVVCQAECFGSYDGALGVNEERSGSSGGHSQTTHTCSYEGCEERTPLKRKGTYGAVRVAILRGEPSHTACSGRTSVEEGRFKRREAQRKADAARLLCRARPQKNSRRAGPFLVGSAAID